MKQRRLGSMGIGARDGVDGSQLRTRRRDGQTIRDRDDQVEDAYSKIPVEGDRLSKVHMSFIDQ